ncbi:MAG: hypothetical protein AVDCRST_MAG06-2882, partial [uncultured Nocardioides sp.]
AGVPAQRPRARRRVRRPGRRAAHRGVLRARPRHPRPPRQVPARRRRDRRRVRARGVALGGPGDRGLAGLQRDGAVHRDLDQRRHLAGLGAGLDALVRRARHRAQRRHVLRRRARHPRRPAPHRHRARARASPGLPRRGRRRLGRPHRLRQHRL